MASGDYRWLRDQTTVERDAAGRVTRLIGALSDITVEKEPIAQNHDLVARQAASIEVLKAISASPDDARPVFDLIARHAWKLRSRRQRESPNMTAHCFTCGRSKATIRQCSSR